MKTWLYFLPVVLATTGPSPALAAASVINQPTAVYSKVYNGYNRAKLPDGKFKPETFVFGNGGLVNGAVRQDKTMDTLPFEQIAYAIADPLARQGYLAATDPAKTDLLILVYWGATPDVDTTFTEFANERFQQDPVYGTEVMMQVANRQRDLANVRVASFLGYGKALENSTDLRYLGTTGGIWQRVINDIEQSRYFVIMVAYDYQTAWKQKKLKPMWSTRYNVRARGTDFTTALPYMTQFAAGYFGRDSKGLVRRLNPTGKVEFGEMKILGIEPETK